MPHGTPSLSPSLVQARLAQRESTLPGGQETAEPKSALVRVGALLRHRAYYCIRFAYYAVLHRGFRHVRWVLAFEGTTWN